MSDRGERVVKDSGGSPVAYQKGMFSTVNGKLVLTNRRLVFTAGKFQSIVELLRGSQDLETDIPLAQVTKVEKGFMATIDVYADKKYTFKGMKGAGEWVAAIRQATQQAERVVTHPPPPPPPPPGEKTCPRCGGQLEFIQEYNRWYCRNCQEYV